MILALLLFLLTPVSGCALCCAYSTRRFEEAFPLCCVAEVLLLLLFGLAGALLAGVYAALALAAVLYLAAARRLIKMGGFRAFLRRFFSPGFGLFLFLALALLFFNYGRMLFRWDEYTHWGDVVWVMSTLDDFATNPLSGSLYPEYPPGVSLFQYFFQKLLLLTGGQISEWAMFYAHQLLFFSFLLPFAGLLNFRRASAYLFIGTLFLCPMLLTEHQLWYLVMSVDCFLALLFACTLAQIIIRREKTAFDYGSIGLSLAFLGLFKGFGLLFALLGLAFLALEGPGSRGRGPWLKRGLAFAGAAVLPRLLWEAHVRLSGAQPAFSLQLGLGTPEGLLGPDRYRLRCLKNFFRAFFEKDMANEVLAGHFLITPVFLLALVSLLLFLLLRLYRRRDSSRRALYARYFWGFFFSLLICFAAEGLAYMFSFIEWEALDLTCYTRYTGTFFLAGFYLALLLAMDLAHAGRLDGNRTAALVLCVQIALTPWSGLVDYLDGGLAHYTAQVREDYEQVFGPLQTLAGGQQSRVWMLSSAKIDIMALRYTLRPHSTNIRLPAQTEGEWASPGLPANLEGEVLPVNAWRQELRDGYDYVLIFLLDDQLRTDYADAFENPADIQGHSVYQVDRESGRLRLCFHAEP